MAGGVICLVGTGESNALKPHTTLHIAQDISPQASVVRSACVAITTCHIREPLSRGMPNLVVQRIMETSVTTSWGK